LALGKGHSRAPIPGPRPPLPAPDRALSIPRATRDCARDQLDDAMERHRVHRGEVHADRVDAGVTRAPWRRAATDVDELSHVDEVAAETHTARRGSSWLRLAER